MCIRDRDKTAYAVSLGIGGMMLFHMDCDQTMDNPNSLTLAVEKTLEQDVYKRQHHAFGQWLHLIII